MEETKSIKEMKSELKTCECKSEFQDKQYGKQKRVHNFCKNHPKPAGKGWRCTVCNNEKHGS